MNNSLFEENNSLFLSWFTISIMRNNTHIFNTHLHTIKFQIQH